LELGRHQVFGHRICCVSCHAVSKHEHESIDKTAKSIGAFDSINYGV